MKPVSVGFARRGSPRWLVRNKGHGAGPIPDNVTLPLLPLRTEAAHTLPVQEGPLLCQGPHHTVPGCDLRQWVWTVHLHGSGAGPIHTETCSERGRAPQTQLKIVTLYFDLWFSFFGTFAICGLS